MHRASEPDRAWRLPGPIPSFYREENRSIEEKGFAQGHPGSGWQSWNWAFEWENVTYSLSPHFSGSCLAAPSPWPHLSLNKYLLNTYYLPDNVRDPEETAVDKTNQTPTQVELTFSFNPNTHLLHLRSRHKLSCCNLKGLVRKNRSAHMRAVQATGPFPWKKRSISWEWPKSFPSATPQPMRILSFDSWNHLTNQILISPFYEWGTEAKEGEDAGQVSIWTGPSPSSRSGSGHPMGRGGLGKATGTGCILCKLPLSGKRVGGSTGFFSGCSEKFTLPALSRGCHRDQPWSRS